MLGASRPATYTPVDATEPDMLRPADDYTERDRKMFVLGAWHALGAALVWTGPTDKVGKRFRRLAAFLLECPPEDRFHHELREVLTLFANGEQQAAHDSDPKIADAEGVEGDRKVMARHQQVHNERAALLRATLEQDNNKNLYLDGSYAHCNPMWAGHPDYKQEG